MSQMTNTLLGRRKPEFYLGKVLWIRGAATTPDFPEGYYIPTEWHPASYQYTYHSIGTQRPAGEAIYIHDYSSVDLKAVPSTVLPKAWEWIVWPLLYLAIVALGFSNPGDPAAGIFCSVIFLPLLGMPFWSWFSNVEPVRARKIGYAILAVTTANNARNRSTR